MRVRLASLLGASMLLLPVLGTSAGCGTKERAPYLVEVDSGFDATPVGDGATFDVATDTGPLDCSGGVDAGICACTEIGQKPPIVYLILDRSGSMAAKDGGAKTRWDLVRIALFDASVGVLRKLGGRIAPAVAVFPAASAGADQCGAGAELRAPATGAKEVYDGLLSALTIVSPAGGTPTAATLRALSPRLTKLAEGGRPVFVLLATDGAPNCAATGCTAELCTRNIEGDVTADGRKCAAPLNCCDPKMTSDGSPLNCVDSAATVAAVSALASVGVKTFVFGIPGTEAYAKDLDALAVAGGTPRDGAPVGERYYAVKSTTQADFVAALQAIAAKVVDDCVVTLESAPTDPGVTNVLVDGVLVPQDPVDGWTWTSDRTIELHGKACAQIKAGLVGRLQVAVGCKTITK